jgi:hypothetical protein
MFTGDGRLPVHYFRRYTSISDADWVDNRYDSFLFYLFRPFQAGPYNGRHHERPLLLILIFPVVLDCFVLLFIGRQILRRYGFLSNGEALLFLFILILFGFLHPALNDARLVMPRCVLF